MYFHEINILYFSRFSVQHFISELEAVRTFKQSCQKAHHDGHNDCYTMCPRSSGPIYSYLLYRMESLFLGHTVCSCILMNQTFYIF